MNYVTIFMAWPYANGPLHLGHVAGNCLPADIQYKFERSKGNRVLMCSGSDEHGTPITVSAEEEKISPQKIVDRYHHTNIQALIDLGCSWGDNIDPRGVEYGGALYNRTSDIRHKEIVKEVFELLLESDFLEEKTMQQYCSVNGEGNVKFLPDRYVEGECPECGYDRARGDQCDECGMTYDTNELLNPRSKMNPDATIEIRDTDHLFFKLNLFQNSLEKHAAERDDVWKPNVRSMTKNWLNMGLRSRAVTRDINWGIELPLSGNKWAKKRVYVWFEAVQGYYTCPLIWSERFADQSGHNDGKNAWQNWLTYDPRKNQKHIYFMGKDNIPFHTIIWPAIIMALNSANSGNPISNNIKIGDLLLENNVASNEYLMLQGGQFSKSRKHAVWLPNFLETYDPDSLRYYLSINMPETHDTDFRWDEYVDRVNNELIGNYGNFINRVLTLTHRIKSDNEGNPLLLYERLDDYDNLITEIRKLHTKATISLERQRFKESLRHIMAISQKGNALLQQCAPWKYLNSEENEEKNKSLSGLALAWRIARSLAVLTRPFMPFQSDRLWKMLGEVTLIDDILWQDAIKFNSKMTWVDTIPAPLFKKLDLNEILQREDTIAKKYNNDNEVTPVARDKESDYIQFEDFLKVEMKTGKILSVTEHPNADKLWIIKLQDSPDSTRTICAGLKDVYEKEKLEGMNVVYVANLEPRKLRGIVSEGMLLAADDGNGNVKLLTPEGEISVGSLVR